MCFGRDYRGKEPFSLYQGFILTTVIVDHDHLVMLASSCCSKVTLFSPLSILYSLKRSHCTQSTFKEMLLEDAIST